MRTIRLMISRLRWLTALVLSTFVAAHAMTAEPRAIDGPDPLGDALSKEGYLCMDLELFRSGYLSTKVKINSVELRLIIDTGATNTHLDPVRTKRLNLQWDPIARPVDGGATHACDVETMRIGTLSTGSLNVGSHDTSDFNSATKKYDDPEIDGVLGGDVLTSHAAVIDYSRNRLFLRPLSSDSPSPVINNAILRLKPRATEQR